MSLTSSFYGKEIGPLSRGKTFGLYYNLIETQMWSPLVGIHLCRAVTQDVYTLFGAAVEPEPSPPTSGLAWYTIRWMRTAR